MRKVLMIFWVLVLVQIVTITEGTPATFPEPRSAETAFLATAFVLSTWTPRLHILVALFVVALHPLTAWFGRDGTEIVILVYVVLVIVHRTKWRREHKLLASSLLVCVPLVEGALSFVDGRESEARASVVDYGDLVGPYHEGGFLRPNLDIDVVGERGLVRFITDEHGFRNRGPVSMSKPDDVFRVVLIGDSFVAGYRVDQDETIGHVLEGELARRLSREVEVLVVGAGHPPAYLEYLREHAIALDPDLVLVGITLGNDLSQGYAEANRLSFDDGPLASELLPDDAFEPRYHRRLLVRVDRSLQGLRAYRRLRPLLLREGVASWYSDWPRRVHVHDAVHGLGHFYTRHPLSSTEAALADLDRDLADMNELCRERNVALSVAIFPQRFQTSSRDWNAAVFRYSLDPSAFDLDRLDDRIARSCVRNDIDCFDLLPAFRDAQDHELYLPLGDMHWSSRGHRLAAEKLAEHLIASSVLNRGV